MSFKKQDRPCSYSVYVTFCSSYHYDITRLYEYGTNEFGTAAVSYSYKGVLDSMAGGALRITARCSVPADLAGFFERVYC